MTALITEEAFLGGLYKTCPCRMHVKDGKWAFKDRELRRAMVNDRFERDGDARHYCKATPGGPDDAMYVCNRIYNTEKCAALRTIRSHQKSE